MTASNHVSRGGHVAFDGFRAGQRATALPVQFFTELLETIDDPDELRVTLYALYAIPRPARQHTLRASALAAVARTFGPVVLPGYYLEIVLGAGAFWVAGFAIFVVVYWPILTGPSKTAD